MAIYVKFLHDVACQKLLTSANVSRSYSKNNTGTVFFETRCILTHHINVSKNECRISKYFYGSAIRMWFKDSC